MKAKDLIKILEKNPELDVVVANEDSGFGLYFEFIDVVNTVHSGKVIRLCPSESDGGEEFDGHFG